jgi:uncharacterized protein (DUF302 family)
MKAAAATPRPNDLDAPGSLAGIPAPDSIFEATRITVDSPHDFDTTRANFDRLVPAFDPLLARDLVLRKAAWTEVEDNIAGVAGPEGFMALSRLDHGALMSLHGQPTQAIQYLVVNPVIARQMVSADTTATLYAPFTVAIHADELGTHISYTTPSSLLGSLGSTDINEVAADLDRRIDITIQKTCREA